MRKSKLPSPHRAKRSGAESLQTVWVLALGAILLSLVLKYMNISNGEPRLADKTSVPSPVQQAPITRTSPQSTLRGASDNTKEKTNFLESALVLGALFAVVGWATKELLVFVRLRAELAVIEVLSDHRPRTYAEITAAVSQNPIHKTIRFVRGAITDALASLVSKGKVYVKHKKYVLAKAKEE